MLTFFSGGLFAVSQLNSDRGCLHQIGRLSKCLKIPTAFLLVSTLAFIALEIPSAAAEIKVPNAGQVFIYRDDWGVPHIFAPSERDGFFGLAYAQAQDQLPEILSMLLAFQGKSSSVYGPDHIIFFEETALDVDLDSLFWLRAEQAKIAFVSDNISSELRDNYVGYINGLKKYLVDHPDEIPPGLPELEPWHALALGHSILAPGYASDGLGDCRAGGVEIAQFSRAGSPAKQVASNEWVLAPWRTATQSTMVLSDPHGGVNGSVFYEFRMHADPLNIAGFTMGPLMLLTHNDNLSWGLTTGAPDVSDCYEINVDSSNPKRYQFDGETKEMVVREVTVQIRGSEPVTKSFEYTEHNGVMSPVVSRRENKAYVVSTPYMNSAGMLDEAIYRLNKSRTVEDVRKALSNNGMYPQNVMVGDRFGDSLFVRAGRTPIRPDGYDWQRPVPGNSASSAWKGLHSIDDLVQLKNPAQGFMQNSNSSLELVATGKDAINLADYPEYISNPHRTHRSYSRARRINEVLLKAFSFTIEDAMELALDEKWPNTELWIQAFSQALNRRPATISNRAPVYRKFASLVLAFDGYANKDSIAALNFYYWRDEIQRQASTADLKPLWKTVETKATLSDPMVDLILGSLEAAVDRMVQEFGTTKTSYGKLFRISRDGERTWPLGGGTPINATNFGDCGMIEDAGFSCGLTQRAYLFKEPNENGFRIAAYGSYALRLVVFSDPLKSFTAHNFGQSSRRESAHYDDKAELLSSERKLKPTYFHPSDLLEHIESLTVIETVD